MLKVKVEPVEQTLYGKVSLPDNPLTIAGYQVFCNDEERHDGEKEAELTNNHVVVEDHGSATIQDGEIEGADRMMTDCCSESDLMVGELGSEEAVVKGDESLGGHNIGEYLQNDVMVDNNIVEEQVVEDGMVLVSPVTHEAQDVIQGTYMETAPTEVLVIEEGAELMVDGIGCSDMMMDGNREYLITSDTMVMEEGEHTQTEVIISQEEEMEAAEENQGIKYDQPEHVVVERINYDMPIIQRPDDTHFYLQDDHSMEDSALQAQQPDPPSPPKAGKHENGKTPKNKKAVRKEGKASEVSPKKKRAAKRKSVEGSIVNTDNQLEGATTKARKRQKSGPAETSSQVEMPVQVLATPEPNKSSSLAGKEGTSKVSPIQANHPTLSLLLSKKGPTELVGPTPGPVAVKKQLFTSSSIEDIGMSSPEKIASPAKPATPPVSKPKTAPVLAQAATPILPRTLLPQVVSDINESEDVIMATTKTVTLTLTPQGVVNDPKVKAAPKPPVKVKHSKNSKLVSKAVLLQVATPITPVLAPTPPKPTVHQGAAPQTVGAKARIQPAAPATQVKLTPTSLPMATISITTPITVAVADSHAVASLPTVKPAPLLTVPKPVRRLQIDVTPSPTSKNMPLVASSPPAAPVSSPGVTRALPVTSPLNVAISPTTTSPLDAGTYTTLQIDSEPLVSPIQKKYSAVTSTLQSRLAAKPKEGSSNGMETLADRYMKEWKPTGRFQCKLCLYSCVTHNFLFRHWVLNHCSLRPYMCGHCGFQSATRDGVTRHQTAKHRGLVRRIFIDNEQQELLWNKFDEMFQGSGFVTEIERQAQASYTITSLSKARMLEAEADQLSASILNKGTEQAERETEVSGGTILKVPTRDKVPGKFQEVILSCSDDQDMGSSQESAEEDGPDISEPSNIGYYIDPTSHANSQTELIVHKTSAYGLLPSQLTLVTTTASNNGVKTSNNKLQNPDNNIRISSTGGSSSNSYNSSSIPTQKQVCDAEADQIYKLITSGTDEPTSVDDAGTLEAASYSEHVAAMLEQAETKLASQTSALTPQHQQQSAAQTQPQL